MKTLFMILVLFGFIVCNGQTENKEEHLDAATVVSEFFKAYKSKDHAKVNLRLHPDVVWIQPGRNNVYTVENGMIVSAPIFSDDIDQEDKFWGKE